MAKDEKKNKRTIPQQIGDITSLPIYQGPKYYANQLYKMSTKPDKYTMSGKSYPTTQEMIDSTPELQGFNVMPKYYTTFMDKKSGKEFKHPAYTSKQVLEEKGAGGITGLIESAVPGLGTFLGVAGGLAGSLFTHFRNKRIEKEEEQNQLDILNQQKTGQVGGSSNPYAATAAMGGTIGTPNVALEKEEVYQTPDGQIGSVDTGSHASGNDQEMYLPEGTRVWSDKLKTSDGSTFAEVAGKIEKMIKKYEKILK